MTDTPQAHPVTGSGLPAGETFYPVPYFFDVMDMPVTPTQACKSEPVTVPIAWRSFLYPAIRRR